MNAPSGTQRTFSHEATAAAFLLGGIGTGNVSLSSRGALVDWEIFNRPAKGLKLPFSFFALRALPEGGAPISRVLEGPIPPPHDRSHGYFPGEVAGLPRFASSRLCGEYPLVWVEFDDPDLPLDVRLEAFTPFVPLDARSSGIPAAVLRYRVGNGADVPMDVSVVGSLPNVCGMDGVSEFGRVRMSRPVRNELRRDSGATGIFYRPLEIDEDSLAYSTLALLTTAPNPTWRTEWLPTHWVDHIQDFWDDFTADGRLEPEATLDAPLGALQRPESMKVGSVGGSVSLEPGEAREFEFVLAWHSPNRPAGWTEEQAQRGTVRNYYATQFADAWDAATYLLTNLTTLETHTREFHRALFTSTLPWYVIDAVASNITVLRSPTCHRLENGAFLGWEGCFDSAGCCEGSCTHVWNYAQTVAFLFPELEQSMRRIEFGLETDDEGAMAFRSRSVYGLPRWEMLPATDGQLGTIVRLYRDWKLSGDGELVRTLWIQVARALDFAFDYWDKDDDFVLDSQQHNTYDIEFFGPNSLSNSFFYAALKAGAEMAELVGDAERAARYRRAFRDGSARMDEMLWNGEYYEQRIDDVDAYRYQYGSGCLSDQLVGQFLAHVAGLGHVLPPEHVRSAMQAIVDHNFEMDVGVVPSVQRTYALPGEPGLLLCTWPRGGRPRLPFVYSDEVWTGIEYQVAATCVHEGLVDEGLRLVRAARERHDGVRRNPWNEVECGHHYARSMSSWALLTALSGYRCDLAAGSVIFEPRTTPDDFRCFFSTGASWGIYHQERNADGELVRWIEVLYGEPVPGWS
jgi:uncharacterized protein (DUF608 family)